MTSHAFYPIGTPGQPWGDVEKAEWRSRQTRQRSYEADVLAVVLAYLDDFLPLQGQMAAETLARRLSPALVRAASRLRAQEAAAPTTLRRATAAGDIVTHARRLPYAQFFAVEEYDRVEGLCGVVHVQS